MGGLFSTGFDGPQSHLVIRLPDDFLSVIAVAFALALGFAVTAGFAALPIVLLTLAVGLLARFWPPVAPFDSPLKNASKIPAMTPPPWRSIRPWSL